MRKMALSKPILRRAFVLLALGAITQTLPSSLACESALYDQMIKQFSNIHIRS